jgi:hypothetical protein
MLKSVDKEFYNQLKIKFESFKRDTKFYYFLKEYLIRLGHWKNLKRGKPDAKNFKNRAPKFE